MSYYSKHDRPSGRPSIAEVAALTRQLRELSAPGRAVDPRDRAAFLADKDDLLARITEVADADTGGSHHKHIARTGRADQPPEGGWWPRAGSADPAVNAVTFDSSGPPDELARFTDRLAPLRMQTDPDESGRRDQLARWHHDDHAIEAESATDRDSTDSHEDMPRWGQ